MTMHYDNSVLTFSVYWRMIIRLATTSTRTMTLKQFYNIGNRFFVFVLVLYI
jgi:hypothetical protein